MATTEPPVTVAKISPFKAAREIRQVLRNEHKRVPYRKGYQEKTDQLVKRISDGELRQELMQNLNAERLYVMASGTVSELYRLSQSIATHEGLPAPERMESSIRAIAAILKNSGVSFTNLEPPKEAK